MERSGPRGAVWSGADRGERYGAERTAGSVYGAVRTVTHHRERTAARGAVWSRADRQSPDLKEKLPERIFSDRTNNDGSVGLHM